MVNGETEQQLLQAASEDGGHVKFLGLAVSEIWKQALVLIPVVAWNAVMVKLLDLVYPGDPRHKNRNLWASVIYAIIATLVVVAILYFYLRNKSRKATQQLEEIEEIKEDKDTVSKCHQN